MRDSAVLVDLAKGGLIVDQIHRSIDPKTPQARRLFSGGNLAKFAAKYAHDLDNNAAILFVEDSTKTFGDTID
jgi:hypothetical protein